MTFALRGLAEKHTVALIGCMSVTVTRGEGVQKFQKISEFICEWSLGWGTKAEMEGAPSSSLLRPESLIF